VRLTTAKELEAVLRLDGPARYAHFVKRVVDEERAWGLWREGWALMADGGGQSCFALWPAPEYAERCAVGTWAGYVAEVIPLADLIGQHLPRLADRGLRPCVFPTPAGQGVTPTASDLIDALQAEAEKYP
jgi:hypothetical protein